MQQQVHIFQLSRVQYPKGGIKKLRTEEGGSRKDTRVVGFSHIGDAEPLCVEEEDVNDEGGCGIVGGGGREAVCV
jgi:hypothetical protein